MSKRKYEDVIFVEPSKKRVVSPSTSEVEDTTEYAYAIFKEIGGPYSDTELELVTIFTNLPEANKEVKAMCEDSDMWVDPSERTKDIGGWQGDIEESFTADGELSIRMEDGEADYEKWWVAHRRLQSMSNYALERRRRHEAEEAEEPTEVDGAQNNTVVEYV